MTRSRWGYLVYGAWFLAWVLLEILGFLGRAPWPTLSETVWNLEGIRQRGRPRSVWQKLTGVAIVGGLAVLIPHLALHWP